ncbi:GtrA family protein [Candidatus Kaiserbacteria bacterium]|nr:GtrA family protein [Candidatus Kaiserbacteria bacterium]
MKQLKMQRFIRYVLVGMSTFLLDLSLLWIFIDYFKVEIVTASVIAFFLAVSLNYVLSRRWAFAGTERAFVTGYLYFLKFALIGAVVTGTLMWFFTTHTEVYFMVTRIVIASVVGVANYLANLYLNFKLVKEYED